MNLSNPYITGNPVYGQGAFIGRTAMLRDVFRTLQNPGTTAMVLFGQRRIGKTSLLLHIRHKLIDKDDYTPIYVDLQNVASPLLTDAIYHIAHKIALQLKVPLPRRDQFDQDGKFFQEVYIPIVVNSRRNQGIVLLLDESDVLTLSQQYPSEKPFLPYLQNWLPSAQGVKCVLSLERRPEDLCTNILSAFKAIPSHKVSLMTREDSETIVRLSEKENSLQWNELAVARVWYWTQGHPYFTQLLCSEIWETLHTTHRIPGNGDTSGNRVIVNFADVDAAVDRTLERGAHAFYWIWHRLSHAEQLVIAALAEIQDAFISREALTAVLKHRCVRALLRKGTLKPETLISRDLLRSIDNGWLFAVPLLRQWVVTEKPLRHVPVDRDGLDLFVNAYSRVKGFSGRLVQHAWKVDLSHVLARLW